jgi:hypothetical protein
MGDLNSPGNMQTYPMAVEDVGASSKNSLIPVKSSGIIFALDDAKDDTAAAKLEDKDIMSASFDSALLIGELVNSAVWSGLDTADPKSPNPLF